MTKALLLCVSFIMLVLGSCATTYVSSGYYGGYESYQVSENIFMVSFNGNGYTTSQQAWLFFLTRAAEIAKEKGFSGFYIIDSKDITSNSQYTTPGYSTSNTTGNISGNYSQYGNTGRLTGMINSSTSTTFTPPQTYNISKPAFMGQIMLVNEKIEGAPSPFNASMVFSAGMELNEKIKQKNTILGIVSWGGIGLVVIGTIASNSN
jgi:hypothetical protein